MNAPPTGDEALAAYHYPLSHVCSLCGAAFVTGKRLILHRRNVHPQKPQKCPQCQKVFNKTKLYLNHLTIHGHRYRCRLCKLRYGTVTLFEEHMRIQHGAEYRILAERSDVVQFIEHYVRVPGEDKLRESSPEESSGDSPAEMPECRLEESKPESQDMSVTERVITNSEGKLVHEMVENGKVVNSFVLGDAPDREPPLSSSPEVVQDLTDEEEQEDGDKSRKSRSESPLEPGEIKHGRIGAIESSQLSPGRMFMPPSSPRENGLASPGIPLPSTGMVPLANLPGFAVSGNVLMPMVGGGQYSMYSSPSGMPTSLPGLIPTPLLGTDMEAAPVLDLSTKSQNDTGNEKLSSSRPSSPSCSKSASSPSPATSPNSAKDDSIKNDTVFMYHCKVCGSSFLFLQEITRHLLVHTKGQPFKCAICKEGFKTERNLDEHLREHKLGFGPFNCPLCNYSSMRHYNLKRHLNTHNPEHTCSVCGVVVGDYSRLRGHMDEHMEKLEVNIASTLLDPETLDRMVVEYKRITALGKNKDTNRSDRMAVNKRRHSSTVVNSHNTPDEEPQLKKGISETTRSKLLERQHSFTNPVVLNASSPLLNPDIVSLPTVTDQIVSGAGCQDTTLEPVPQLAGHTEGGSEALTDIQAMRALYGAVNKPESSRELCETSDNSGSDRSSLETGTDNNASKSTTDTRGNDPPCGTSPGSHLGIIHEKDVIAWNNNNNPEKFQISKEIETDSVELPNDQLSCPQKTSEHINVKSNINCSSNVSGKEGEPLAKKKVTVMVPTPEGLFSYVADRQENNELKEQEMVTMETTPPLKDSFQTVPSLPDTSKSSTALPISLPSLPSCRAAVTSAGSGVNPGLMLPCTNSPMVLPSPLLSPPGLMSPLSLLPSPLVSPSGIVGPGSLLPVFSALDKSSGPSSGDVSAAEEPSKSEASSAVSSQSSPLPSLPSQPAVCQLPLGYKGLPPPNMYLVPMSSGAQLMGMGTGGVMQPVSLPLSLQPLPTSDAAAPLTTLPLTIPSSTEADTLSTPGVTTPLASPTQSVWPEMVVPPSVQSDANNPPLKLRCKKCPKEFSEYRLLGAHMAEHVRKVSLLACAHCRLQFRKPHHLEQHMSKAHENGDNSANNKLLNCELCTYSTSRNYNLQRHMKIHRDGETV